MNSKNTILFIFIFLISCAKDENTDLVSNLLFECYNPAIDGVIAPEVYMGIPLKCTQILFEEDFNNNNKNWTESSDSWISYKVQNGFYKIKTKDMYSYQLYNVLGSSNALSKNYQFEMNVQLMQESTTARVVGLTFNKDSWKYNFFGFNNEEIIYGSNETQNSAPVNILSKTNSNLNDFKKITVRNFEGKIYMFLDEILVFESVLNTVNSTLGFILPQNSDVSIDDIKIIEWDKF